MTLPGEWRLCWSAVSPLVYLLVAGPTRPVPLGTVIVVLRLKNPVGTGLVKVTYIQHTTIQCMGGRGGVEDLDPAVSGRGGGGLTSARPLAKAAKNLPIQEGISIVQANPIFVP